MDDSETPLEERVASFLRRNFPQILLHGGVSSVERVDESAGEVWIELGGACGGCGVSPMTVRAIEARLPRDVPAVTQVHVETTETSEPAA